MREAKNAKSVIGPELGKGHSNKPEATFSALTKFRAKDANLHQKHNQVSTNLGLIQANMTRLFKEKGAQYHWIIDLLLRWVFQYSVEFRRLYANKILSIS